MNAIDYFKTPNIIAQKQYEALRMYFVENMIIGLRKSYYSVEGIKVALDSKGISVAEKTIYNVTKAHGFAHLPRRQKLVPKSLEPTNIRANKAASQDFSKEHFSSSSVGLLCLLLYTKDYGISDLI